MYISINKQSKIIIKNMRSFIFLITFIALVSSIFNLELGIEDNYGCRLPFGASKCCWVNKDNCCKPFDKRNCKYMQYTCCKVVDGIKDGRRVFKYINDRLSDSPFAESPK